MKYNIQNHPQTWIMSVKSLFIFSLFLILSSCASEVGEEVRNKFESPKYAFGPANKLCVVADKDLWESNIGDTIRYYFGSAYPILPQPEPFFDLIHFTPDELEADPYRRELRAYLFVGDLTDQDSPSCKMIRKDIGSEKVRKANEQSDYHITVGKDKWAHGQVLIYLFAQNKLDLVEAIKQHFPVVTKRFNKADESQYEAAIYFNGVNNDLKEKLKAKFAIDLRIPSDYFLAIEDEETIWMRKETEFLSSNIMVHKIPYTDQSQLTKEGLKAIRDRLGKKYVSTEIKNTYMRINDVDLPMMIQAIELNGNYTVEARGIWDIVNDFMGGPFLGYLVHNAKTNELLYIDCFIHAPGKKKRNYIQQLEYVVSSLKF